MKLECGAEKIKTAILAAERGTGKNLNLPVLGAILFIAKKNELLLRSTNLDIGIEIRIPANIKEEGMVAVPAGVLNGFFSNIQKDDTVYISKTNDNILIETKHNKATINSVPYEDFPNLPAVKEENSFSINSDILLKGIKSVVYSASLSDIKPELGSLYMYPEEGDMLVFVATDSFRLAEKKIKIDNIPEFSGVLIPYKNTIDIVRVFEIYQGDITIHYNQNQISFQGTNVTVYSRLVNGDFPDYAQLIPKNYKTQATVLKQDFINALKTGSIFSDKFNKTAFIIDPQKNTFTITTKNTQTGETTVSLDGTLEGESVDILCNHKYLGDALQSIPQDSIVLSFNGPDKALTLKGVGDNTFLYLVSPMNK